MRIRSLLFAPGNQERKLQRVFDFGSDAVDLDLEDAVPAAEKERARALVRETVRARAQSGASRPRIVV
ncbi:MAG TPA: aldolase/citrate lyase family protein, partial [Bacillota bacterium]